MVLVLGQVVVGSVGNAPEFAPTKREEVFKVGRCAGVEAEFFRIVVTKTEVFALHVEVVEEVFAVILPVCKPFKVCAGLAEEFEFHLFEFTGTEREVTGRDFVSEGLTDLCNAEGNLLTGGSCNILEVDEDTLCGFGTEVQGVGGVFGNALERLEHQVELTDIGKVSGAAGRAGDVVFLDIVLHFSVGHTCGIVGEVVFCNVFFDELVRTVTGLTDLAVHKRVGEAAEVTGSNPCFGVHQDCGVQTDVVGAFLDKLLPPSALDVVLQFNAERAVVPGVCKTAVNFGAGVNEAAVFTQRDHFFHCFFSIDHYGTHLSL